MLYLKHALKSDCVPMIEFKTSAVQYFNMLVAKHISNLFRIHEVISDAYAGRIKCPSN